MSSPACSLLSTTRFDPRFLEQSWNTQANAGTPSPFYLLPYHRDRLLVAAQAHGWVVPEGFLALSTLDALCHNAVKNDESTATAESCRVVIYSQCFIISAHLLRSDPYPALPCRHNLSDCLSHCAPSVSRSNVGGALGTIRATCRAASYEHSSVDRLS